MIEISKSKMNGSQNTTLLSGNTSLKVLTLLQKIISSFNQTITLLEAKLVEHFCTAALELDTFAKPTNFKQTTKTENENKKKLLWSLYFDVVQTKLVPPMKYCNVL